MTVSLLLSATWPVRAETLLAIPFENQGQATDLDWVGESFAEALTERLAASGHILVTREERLAALERLGLPSGIPLTRASWLRLAEEAGADWLVLGQFVVDDGRLRGQARLLDVNRLVLSPALEAEGSFADLLQIQGELAWEILCQLDPAFSLSQQAFLEQFPWRRVSAFESYVRGLLALNREQQLRYFQQAVRLQPDYSAPAFRLGQLYFEDQDYGTAANWLEKIPLESNVGLDARFYLALCHFFARAYGQALDTLAPVAERLPVAPVWNNLGVFASRQGDDAAALNYFARARESAPGDPDIYFNLALHHLRREQWQQAVETLEQCVHLDVGDTEAHFLRALALEKLGRVQEAERARQKAVGDNPALLLSLERRQLDLDRLRLEFNSRRLDPTPAATGARTRHVAIHIQRGKELIARGQFQEAQQQLTQAILLAPDSHLAHFLLAEIFQRQGQAEEAIGELKAALWSDEGLPARLRLAEILLTQNRLEEAREQIGAVLAVDPGNAAARALEARLAAAAPGPAAGEARSQ